VEGGLPSKEYCCPTTDPAERGDARPALTGLGRQLRACTEQGGDRQFVGWPFRVVGLVHGWVAQEARERLQLSLVVRASGRRRRRRRRRIASQSESTSPAYINFWPAWSSVSVNQSCSNCKPPGRRNGNDLTGKCLDNLIVSTQELAVRNLNQIFDCAMYFVLFKSLG
jgi:hypothetical protein